jgi:hypothetical protein
MYFSNLPSLLKRKLHNLIACMTTSFPFLVASADVVMLHWHGYFLPVPRGKCRCSYVTLAWLLPSSVPHFSLKTVIPLKQCSMYTVAAKNITGSKQNVESPEAQSELHNQ